MKSKKVCGSLTIFLALTLSMMVGFILTMIGFALTNAGKVRMEYITDTAMNAVLSEFHVTLEERYGLLYLDSSYLVWEHGVENVEGRLCDYINKNIASGSKTKNMWSTKMKLQKATISKYKTASEKGGNSIYHQAVHFSEDAGILREETEVEASVPLMQNLEQEKAFDRWTALQEQLAEMAMPKVLDQNNQWEEITLENPADAIYALTGSEILYLVGVETNEIGVGRIDINEYASRRDETEELSAMEEWAMENENACLPNKKAFLNYLFQQMSYFGQIREDAFLQYQLEYLIVGRDSDWGNLQAVATRLLEWRFADNAIFALQNQGMYAKAEEIASSLHAVTLQDDLRIPVTMSILYAWAYMESISDLRGLYDGNKVSLIKNSFVTTIDCVLTGNFAEHTTDHGSIGLTYGQYLAGMLFVAEEDDLKLRCMDIMEMDVRHITGNTKFTLDYCIERIQAEITMRDRYGKSYELNRAYGYY